MSLSRLFGRKPAASLQAGDAAYISPVHSALVHEGAATALWAVGLMLAVVVTGVVWAAMTKVDVVTKATARVVPDGREQVIASLEGGILRELLVIEGQLVVEGQALAMLDPTRAEAQQAEGQARRLALRGAAARLHAEATGGALRFPPELDGAAEIIEGETASFNARTRSLSEGLESTRRSVAPGGRGM
jgi:adhesin transport system membrane fusion protein